MNYTSDSQNSSSSSQTDLPVPSFRDRNLGRYLFSYFRFRHREDLIKIRKIIQFISFGLEIFGSVASLCCGLSLLLPVKIYSTPFSYMLYQHHAVWGILLFLLGVQQLWCTFVNDKCLSVSPKWPLSSRKICELSLCIRPVGCMIGGLHWGTLCWYVISMNYVLKTGWNVISIVVYGLIAMAWAVVWWTIPEGSK